ncbi:hypothetical protein [Pacificibacter sp. AS14]|uniref:hypothetical protein n=1 Tax=Pacificibacter sp. AS14 TaxID=3135785 RepID=UPI00317DBFEA
MAHLKMQSYGPKQTIARTGCVFGNLLPALYSLDQTFERTALQRTGRATYKITVFDNPSHAAFGAAGLINGPPVCTQFLNGEAAQGLVIISSWELFFYQSVDAWSLFSNTANDENFLRRSLLKNERTQKDPLPLLILEYWLKF